MIKLLVCTTILFLSLVFQDISAQNYPKNYFRSPLDIPLSLSGCFGELRTNHFHTGLDIKTKGVIGLNVYAIADGYISRMQVSEYGYGKVLYLNHPNGFTSVYAHLNGFHPKIEKVLREQQYLQQKDQINVESIADTLLKFKKGDIIGYSGNTGHSGGPHLHFEIRDTKTEKALNPWLFGFEISDNIAPTLYHLKVYQLSKDTIVYRNKRYEKIYTVKGSGENQYLSERTPIHVNDYTGFAIHTIDLTNGSGNQCGVYSVEFYKNDTLLFKQKMDAIDFSKNRFINAHMDYFAYKDHKNSYHKTFIDGNNQLGIYPTKIDDGWLKLKKGETAKLKFVIKDINGNTSSLKFEAVNDAPVKELDFQKCETPFYWYTKNSFQAEGISIQMDSLSIYNDLCFDYSVSEKKWGMIAPVHALGDPNLPVQNYYSVSITTDTIPDSLQQKVVGVYISNSGGINSEGGIYINGAIHFKTRAWGKYSAMLDTVAPVITPYNIYDGKNMSANTEIIVKVADNLSGIKKYDAYLDGKWILMHYVSKKGYMHIYFNEEKVEKGDHEIEIIVSDERENKSTYKAKFSR